MQSETKKLIENADYLNGDHIDDQSKSESYSKEESSYDETFNHLNNYDNNSKINNKEIVTNREPIYLNETTKQKNVLIMGLRKSGKSSIQKVVFHKMSPNETFFLESSNKIIKDDIQASSFVFFTIYTLPGDIDNLIASSNEVNNLLNSCDALVYVLDAQDDYSDALSMLNFAIIKANKLNPNIKFEVFIHKVDCVSDDNKLEIQRDIYTRVKGDLNDCDLESVKISFHLTSIYDHSIFEAFSKVVQKLIPQLPILENLLDIFITNSGIDKAFLFDVVSKIYLATDSSAVDMQSYELCCDVIDTVVDTLSIYGVKDENELATFNECSSTIKLNNQTVLYLREVNNYLALVCILREENFDKQGLIDYNFQCFKDAINEIFSTKNDEEIVIQVNGENEEQFSIENSSKNSLGKDEKFLTDESSTTINN